MNDRFALGAKEAWEAFEAQLDHTVAVIQQSRSHGYQDDQGDYLFSALELSAELQHVAMDGDDNAMVDKFFELASLEPDSMGGKMPKLYFFASDGIASEVVNIIEKISGVEF